MSRSRTTSELLQELMAKEDLSVVRGLGSLAFVRAQGRTLEERSQEKVLQEPEIRATCGARVSAQSIFPTGLVNTRP